MKQVAPPEVARRLEAFKAVARDAGIKLTHQRLEIFREVASSLEHPNAEAVFRAVCGRMPTVSLDTVYRTLWTLGELGLLRPMGPRREAIRFDANLDPHHHYVCTRCGLTRDVNSRAFDALRVPAAVSEIGDVSEMHVEMRGVCSRCARSATRTPNQPGARRKRDG